MESTEAGRAVHPVSISGDGTLTPDFWSVNVGDIVELTSNESDAVLCFSDTSVFGSHRFEIPEGQSVRIVVQKFAVDVFIVVTRMGSLSTRCVPTEDVGDGKGGGAVSRNDPS